MASKSKFMTKRKRFLPILVFILYEVLVWLGSLLDDGTVSMLFEFERQACVDIHSVLIAAGRDLSQSGPIRFTELRQCTRSQKQDCGTEIASIDLEVQTFPVAMVQERQR